jgi:hypothetical protein
MFVPAVEMYSGAVVSIAIYLTSTDVPVVQARASEAARSGGEAEEPVNAKVKNRLTAPLDVPLKPTS